MRDSKSFKYLILFLKHKLDVSICNYNATVNILIRCQSLMTSAGRKVDILAWWIMPIILAIILGRLRLEGQELKVILKLPSKAEVSLKYMRTYFKK